MPSTRSLVFSSARSNLPLKSPSNNTISSLPGKFSELNKLEVVCLGGNKLTTAGVEMGKLDKLDKLTVIFLNKNHLDSIPLTITKCSRCVLPESYFRQRLFYWPFGFVRLQKLSLCNNRISSLSKELQKLTALVGKNSKYWNSHSLIQFYSNGSAWVGINLRTSASCQVWARWKV